MSTKKRSFSGITPTVKANSNGSPRNPEIFVDTYIIYHYTIYRLIKEELMASTSVFLRRIPKYERLERFAEGYPSLNLDATALQAYFTLLGVAGEVSAEIGANLARYGVGEGRFMVLVLLLEHHSPLSHSELAEMYGVTKGNITGLVDGLERAGYVKREKSGHDRRVRPIALTQAGRLLVEKLLPEQLQRVAGFMGELSISEHKLLVSLLRKVQAGLSALKEG
jgi:DNA-binding MarR family transcriptional regulator